MLLSIVLLLHFDDCKHVCLWSAHFMLAEEISTFSALPQQTVLIKLLMMNLSVCMSIWVCVCADPVPKSRGRNTSTGEWQGCWTDKAWRGDSDGHAHQIRNEIWHTGDVANTLNAITNHHTPKERKSASLSELQNHQPHLSCEQSDAESHPEQTQTTGRVDHSQRTGWFSWWKKHHRSKILLVAFFYWRWYIAMCFLTSSVLLG